MPIIRFVFYPVVLALAIAAASLSLDASRINRLASAQLGVDQSTEIAWKSLLENLSFSMYSGASDIKADAEALFREANRRESLARGYSFVLLAVSMLMLGVGEALRRRGYLTLEVIVADLIAIAMICLGVGLVAPILILKAYTTVPVVGEVILKFEVKSILTTIGALAKAGNYFIALLVAAFSVVTPLVKLVVAVAVLQHRWSAWHTSGLKFIKTIGKWSMADVFVVAVLVAYFAAGADEFSEAHLGIGLYFFAGYCLLSMLVTHLLMLPVDSRAAAHGATRLPEGGSEIPERSGE